MQALYYYVCVPSEPRYSSPTRFCSPTPGRQRILWDQEDLGCLTAAEIQRRSDPANAQAYAPYSKLYVAEFVVPCFASSVAMAAGPLVLSENVLSGEQADFDAAVEMATGIIKSVRSCTHS